MHRFLFFLWLLGAMALQWPVATTVLAADLPARPSPFQFITDQGQLLSPGDAKKLESGLRRYADNTGTQIVVVTVPTLAGRDIADYGRALGEAWGVGQRGKNNGLVVLLAGQEHKVTIQAGSGLRNVITPELTARVINQQMTPSFKQGNYFAGLRTGLNTLMLAANPSSDPRKNEPGATPHSATNPSATSTQVDEVPATAAAPEPAVTPPYSAPEPQSSGFGIETLLVGALVVGGIIWLLSKLFRRRTTPANSPVPGRNAPDFLPNSPTGPTAGYSPNNGTTSAPDFLPNRSGIGGSGIGGGMSGSGMGGALLTGAAAAAGAYLGNRMASGHNQPESTHLSPDDNRPALDNGVGSATSGGFPFMNDTNASSETAPDYFSESADSSPDYFSSDDSSYNDTSSDDTGGSGFDSTDDNTGSW